MCGILEGELSPISLAHKEMGLILVTPFDSSASKQADSLRVTRFVPPVSLSDLVSSIREGVSRRDAFGRRLTHATLRLVRPKTGGLAQGDTDSGRHNSFLALLLPISYRPRHCGRLRRFK